MSATLELTMFTPTDTREATRRPLNIAIAGNPNAGKTSLFNALTGLRQKVANYPGVTVESKIGEWILSPELAPARLIDLPGLYSLDATSLDEEIARDVLLSQAQSADGIDAIVVVVDATNLVRNLYLATQLIETGKPIVVALTMFDLVLRNNLKIDVEKLSTELGVPVVPLVAKQRRGLSELASAVLAAAALPQKGSYRDTAMPPDVRKRFALPLSDRTDLGCARELGVARKFIIDLPEGPRPSAHQAAQPSASTTFEAKPAVSQRAPAASEVQHHASDVMQRQSNLIRRYAQIERIVSEATEVTPHGKSTSERIDRFVTHRFLGPLILLLVLLVVFQSIFSWATLPMTLIENVFGALGAFVRLNFPAGLLTDLLVDGVIAGVGGVLVFLPQILLLFFFIAILEDSGYMARAAFLMDRLMRSVGLHGKAFMPLLSSFACAVPGIMATRTIENPKDRIATIMIAPFMSCSARLPVYTLMIGALFAGQKVLGFVSTGALIILGMYLLGIVAAIAVASLLKRTVLKAPAPSFVMEMPPYRMPSIRNVGRTMFMRATIFLKRAGTVILVVSILLWALAAFPRASASAGDGSQSQQLEQSFVGRAGHVIEPLIRPLGFDWKIGVGLISSFAARETIISTLSVVYNAGDDSENQSLVGVMQNAKRADGSPVWTPLVGLSLMVFFVLACQCMSTIAIVRRETNSWRWPAFMVGYMMLLAYVASLITFQGGRLLGFS